MTKLEQAILIVALVASGVGLCLTAEVFCLQSDLRSDERKLEVLRGQVRQTSAQRDSTANRLKALDAEIDAKLASAPSANDLAMEGRMRSWLGRADHLKAVLKSKPEWSIPELALLTERDWFRYAAEMKDDSEKSVRTILADLRGYSENRVAPQITRAMQLYLRANNGVPPSSTSQLGPYLDSSVDPAILDRFEVLSPFEDTWKPKGDTFAVGLSNPVDMEYDHYIQITSGGGYGGSSAVGYDLIQAMQAYSRDHTGQSATEPAQLTGYLKWSLDPADLEKYFAGRKSRASK